MRFIGDAVASRIRGASNAVVLERAALDQVSDDEDDDREQRRQALPLGR